MPDAFLPRTETTAARPVPAWAKKPRPKTKATHRSTRTYAGPREPHQHARAIAENVLNAWYQHFGGSSIELPLGTVAALSLLRNAPGLADHILRLTPEQLPRLFKEIYLGHWLKRPDLINRATPLHDWAWNPEPDRQQLRAVHAVTRTALTTGLMDLTGHDDPGRRSEADILSPLLTGLRHKSDKKWRGEYHTPATVTDLMARMVIDQGHPEPGQSICDPAVGSGTMLRSAAQRLRELDLDPHDFHWFGVDIDRLSAACATINAIIWDLGPRCLIACANSLAPDDIYAAARAEALEAYEERDRYLETATTIAATKQAVALLNDLTGKAPAA